MIKNPQSEAISIDGEMGHAVLVKPLPDGLEQNIRKEMDVSINHSW